MPPPKLTLSAAAQALTMKSFTETFVPCSIICFLTEISCPISQLAEAYMWGIVVYKENVVHIGSEQV